MLISWNRPFSLILVRSFNPVPSSISMSSETPRIKKTALISCSTSKADHHACGTSCLTESCGVINSYLRSFSSTIEFDPWERSFLNTETPYIIYCFLTSITTENEEVWFRKDNGVAISSSWSWADDRDDHPLSLVLTISHVEEVEIVTCETSTAGGTTIYDHLHLLYVCGSMCSSWRRRYASHYIKSIIWLFNFKLLLFLLTI